MLWSLLVFGVVGLLVGAAARLFYPERQTGRVIGSLLLGLIGALAGGAISWLAWPFEETRFHSGNLLLAFLGAGLVIAVTAVLAYAQDLAARQSQTPSQ